MKPQLTRELAYAAGFDEANRSMWDAGRRIWNEEDYRVACETFNRLWPKCVHGAHPGECDPCLRHEEAQTSPQLSARGAGEA